MSLTAKRSRWPRYRGKRAGKQVKDRTSCEGFRFRRVKPRQPKRNCRFKKQNRSRNPFNCTPIVPAPSQPNSNETHFVPSFFLSNVMSLAPKIDEVSTVVQNANYDLVCSTETWLRRHIPDSAVNITGYNLIRLDRKEAMHGGVCLYVKEHIPFSILEDFGDDNNNLLEVLWVKLRPPRLPRGFSNIIVGLICDPIWEKQA